MKVEWADNLSGRAEPGAGTLTSHTGEVIPFPEPFSDVCDWCTAELTPPVATIFGFTSVLTVAGTRTQLGGEWATCSMCQDRMGLKHGDAEVDFEVVDRRHRDEVNRKAAALGWQDFELRTFRDILDSVVADTQERARGIAKSAEHAPIVMLIHGEEVVPTLMAGAPGDILPRVLANQQPDAYVLVLEARIQAGGDPAPGEIANNPENPEALLMVACVRGGRPRTWMANIWPAELRAARRRGEREVGVWQEPPEDLGVMGSLVIEDW